MVPFPIMILFVVVVLVAAALGTRNNCRSGHRQLPPTTGRIGQWLLPHGDSRRRWWRWNQTAAASRTTHRDRDGTCATTQTVHGHDCRERERVCLWSMERKEEYSESLGVGMVDTIVSLILGGSHKRCTQMGKISPICVSRVSPFLGS